MKNIIHAMMKTLRTATPIYLAVLVVCGMLANAGINLPEPMKWAYTPVEKTTMYAMSFVEDIEAAKTPPLAEVPESMTVAAGVFENVHVTSKEQVVPYVIRIPEGIVPKMPLVVYLHDEGVTSIPELAGQGVVQAAEMYDIDTCIIIQPLLDDAWTTLEKEAIVRDMTQSIVSKFYCDETRVILTGFGAGAKDVWTYATMAPDYWQNISPISAAAPADITSLYGNNVSCYLVCGEYDVYAIKGAMKQAGTTLTENGASVVQVIVEEADHDTVRNAAYDNDWFAWACQ